MAVRFLPMSKKRKSDTDADVPVPKGTKVIRIEADLVPMLNHIAIARGVDVSEVASPILRPEVERIYAEVMRGLCDKLPKQPE